MHKITIHRALTTLKDNMAKDQKGRVPLLIAMKGHPGSGKSTLARALASALHVPLIDKDDVRDSTFTLQQQRFQLQPGQISSLLNDMSYHAISRIASTQLSLGLSVIVDSPLSRRAHLDRLVQLAACSGARVLVVECKPNDEAEWRRRLERRADEEDSCHKPRTWGHLERLLDAYAGCTEYDVGGVPKMTVDTTAAVGVDELVSSVLQFIELHKGCPVRSEHVGIKFVE